MATETELLKALHPDLPAVPVHPSALPAARQALRRAAALRDYAAAMARAAERAADRPARYRHKTEAARQQQIIDALQRRLPLTRPRKETD